MKTRLLSIAALAASLSSCILSGQRPIAAPDQEVTVKVMRIGETLSDRTERFVGELVADRSAIITAEFPARLSSLKVRKGSRVAAGDTIAVLFSQSLVSARDGAKATYDRASDALERIRKMQGSGAVSEIQIVEAESKYAQAEAAYTAAEDALSSCCVTAPFSGVVSDVLVEQGVRLALSQPIVRLVDLNSLRVSFTVGENELSAFPRGSRVTVEVPAAGKTFNASVESVSLEASPLSRTYWK